MPIYEYKAYAEGGSTRTGVIDADTPREARQRLRKDKLLVSDLRVVRKRGKSRGGSPAVSAKGKGDSRGKDRKPGFLTRYMEHRRANSGGASGRDLELVGAITRQLGTLLGAGIPLAEALRAIIEQAESRRIETLFRELRERITQGNSLGDSLAEHPELFSELYVNMVRAGEATGQVDVVLTRLADFLQAQRALQRKVVSALTYPLLMVGLGVIVVSILMAVVVPRITAMLKDTGQTLPLPTQILVGVSEFFKVYWWVLFLAVAAISALLERYYRSPKGRMKIDRFLLGVPLLGELFRKRAVSRFSRTLATLLSSGVPAVQALEITADVVGNQVIAKATTEIKDKIIEGTDIASPLKATGVFPASVGYMVSVGEASGELEQMLDRVADAYDEEVDVVTERVTTVLEPIMIVVLAVIVGFIVISIVLPILQTTQIG
ncbi:type II secretion system F family protein [Engelhardtia mirabilis]|uniref:General secretion pathway protein F n=1 Tax=Engelhardtia mirabilis TaxID=2528011 RepID=A0A518BJN8_9BACT|nr:Type II secretion system protein F [Planctomycetes bacterium Pla133]QDV01521.1 Type II secretion system protein F [Planctomycetes bacterium Pla86]